MISNRFRWALSRELQSHVNRVTAHTAKSLKDRDNKPLDAAPLYIHLFGSLTPISLSFIWPPQTQTLTCLFKGTASAASAAGAAVQSPRTITAIQAFGLPKVADGRSMLRLPISLDFVKENHQEWIAIPNTARTQSLGIFTRRYSNDNIPVFENEQTLYGTEPSSLPVAVTPELIGHVRRAIVDVYGEEVMEAIDRVSEITRRIRDLDSRVSDYTQNVKSVGALFKMLPPLLSLSRTAANVRHIKIAREAVPPSADLLSDLNLLASLVSATGANS